MPAARAKRSDRSLDGFLCFTVYSTALAFTRAYKPLLDSLGLTYPQYLVLLSLWRRGEQTVGAIGDDLFLESNTLTPLIKRLEAAGLVNRRRDAADERVVRVSLTEAGRTLAAEAACLPERLLEATGMSAEEIEAGRKALAKVRESLTTPRS